MRWVGRTLLTLGVLVVGYAVWAFTAGAVLQTQASVRIARPAEEVFPYLVEPELLRQWLGGLVETRALTEGPTRAGFRSVEVIEVDGQRTELELEVVSFRPPHLLRVRLASEFMTSQQSYELVPDAREGTRIDYRAETRMRGLLVLAGPLARLAMREKVEADLAQLKKLLEDDA